MRSFEKIKCRLSSFSLTILVFILTASCEIGMGSAVDTLVPEITVETPSVGAVIRDSFKVSGNWSDDGFIGGVLVTLRDTENETKYGPFTAEFETAEGKTGQGSWNCIIEKDAVPDGTYEANITIADSVGHMTEIQRQFVIDNTSPVLVMQRPASKIGSTSGIEKYGRVFTIDGQAADDNGIGLLEVNVYSDEELNNLLKTISFTSVPNTISLDVAKFIQDTYNDYSVIYGSTNYTAGQKTLYCKIIAYDGAKRYPTDGSEQTEEDLKGNPTSEYYLYDEISADILTEHKITELYTMKNGRYFTAKADRAIADATMKSLAERKIDANVFTLNPRNNPIFSIAGFSEMAPTGNFEAANMYVSNGDFLTIQVEPGLDGYLLQKDTLRVKVKKIGEENAPYIYPSEQTISKDGDKYRIIAFMKKEDGLISSNSYTVEVEGVDEEDNAVVTQNDIGYGFYFKRSVVVPSISVTNPNSEDEITLNASANSLTISGTVSFPADLCNGGTVKIKGSNTLIWTVGNYTATDQIIPWTYTIDLKKGRTETADSTGKKYLPDGQYQLEVYAEYYEIEDEAQTDLKDTSHVIRTYLVDTKKPEQISTVSNINPAPGANGWCSNQNLSITVNAIDNNQDGFNTGVVKTEYAKVSSGTQPDTIPNNAWEQLSGTTQGFLNGLEDGVNYLYFRATDGVGNVSDLPSSPYDIKIDAYPPVINKIWLGKDAAGDVPADWMELSTETQKTIASNHGKKLKVEISENNNLDATAPVTVNVKVGSGTAQPAAGTVSAGGTATWIWTSTNDVSTTENTTIEISVKAKDAAGGESSETTVKYLIDTDAPNIHITQPAQDLDGNKSISTTSSTLRAAINDDNGTIKFTKYKLTSTAIPINAANPSAPTEAEIAAAIIADVTSPTAAGWITQSDLDKGSVSYPIAISEGTGIRGNITPNAEGNGPISEGHWYFYVYSIDDAGNAFAKKREFWTDLKVPALTVTQSPAQKYNKTDLGTDNTLASITVSGTADDENGVVSVFYSTDGGANWTTTNIYNANAKTWTFTETYGTDSSRTLNDGTYTFVIKATDTAGKTKLSTSYPVRIDCNPPVISSKTFTPSPNSDGWLRNKTIIPSIVVSDPDDISEAGNIKVEYSITGTFDSANPKYLTNTGTVTDSSTNPPVNSATNTGGVSFTNDGNNTLYVRAIDEAGNISSTGTIENIKIDTGAPVVNEKFYQIGSQDIVAVDSRSVYINGEAASTLTIWGEYKDTNSDPSILTSGVDEITQITLNGLTIPFTDPTDSSNTVTIQYSTDPLPSSATGPMPTFSDYAAENAGAIKSWKAVIPNNKLGTTGGNISVSGKDLAGNTGNASGTTINLIKDTTPPDLSNISVTDDSGSGTRVYASAATTYWLDNSKVNDTDTTGRKFIIKGITTDNNIVDSTTITITGTGTTGSITKTYSYLTGTTAKDWSFIVQDLHDFTDSPATVTLTATDIAGNTNTKTLTLNFDSSLPEFKHRIDANKKDVNFRIGEYENDNHDPDVGGKYQPGTWGTAESLIIRGTVEESGSGLSKIYYKIVDSSAVTSFNKDDAGVRTIDPSALTSANATKTVYYTYYTTNENGEIVEHKSTVSITSSFKGEISGLSEGINYLLLMAEDNVGHLVPDTMFATAVNSNVTLSDTEIANWNNGIRPYKLNVDRHAPELTRALDTQFTNGSTKVVISGTCSDPDTAGIASGVKSVKVSVTIGTGANATKHANVVVNNGNWTATFEPAAGATSWATVENKTYNIQATVTDNAGLETSKTVAILQGDTGAPTASLINITNSVEKDGSYYIRPTLDNITVKGNTDDTYSTTVYTYLKVVPYKITGSGASAQEIEDGSAAVYIRYVAPTAPAGTSPATTNITQVTPATNPTWELTIPAGTLSLTDSNDDPYTGAHIYACTKDLAGNSNNAGFTTGTGSSATVLPVKLIYDENAPEFIIDDDAHPVTVGGQSASDIATAEAYWHNNSSLSLEGYWNDANAAGLKAVYYKVLQDDYNVEADPPEYTFNNSDNSWKTFAGTEESDGTYKFRDTISNFENGSNYVYMYAEDKLGNAVYHLSKLKIKIDTAAPTATDGYTDSDGKEYSFNDIYLTNGNADKILYFYIDDTVSGIKIDPDDATKPVGAKIKFNRVELNDSQSSISLSDVAGSTTKKLVTVTIKHNDNPTLNVLSGNGHRAVVVTLQDNAGNKVDTTVGTINMDTTPPSVRLNAPKDANTETSVVEVNNTITITGTATDAYLKERPLTAFEYSTNGTTWTPLITDFSTSNTNVVNDADFSVKINTKASPFADGSTYSIRAKVKDEAGNEGTSDVVTFKVDQSTDRPVIKFTNLQLPATTETTETKADITLSTVTLKGTITDDDDLFKENGAYTADSFQIHYITMDDAPNAVPVEIEDTIQVNSGAWSYTFETNGKYEVVFIVKDGAGTTFTAGATTSSAQLQATPKLTDGTNWLGTHAAGSHTEFILKVDTKLPVTQNMEFKLDSDPDTAWSATLPNLGGPPTRATNNKFLLRLVAGDEIGITSVTGKLDTDTTARTATKQAEETSGNIQGREVKQAIWQFGVIDISSLTGGSHSLELTITDGAGNEKKETITLSIDRTAPELTIVTPTENSLESASIWANGTISGAKDQGLKYAISTTGQANPTDTLDVENEITSWEEFDDSTNTATTRTLTNSTYVPEYSDEMDFGITWNIYFDNDTSSTADTHDKLLNEYLIDMGITTDAALSATDSTQFSKLVRLYLWMQAEDEVGNVIEKAFPIILDPQGDRPTLNFTYPDEAGKMLGGKVTIYGTVEDTLGDHPGVDTVWVQPVSSIHWKEDPSDNTNVIVDDSTGWGSFTANASNEITAFTLTTKDLDYLASNGYHVYNMKTYTGSSSDVEWTAGSSVASGYTVNDYAVKATVSGTAWLLDINGNKEFNPSGTDISSVALRVYARDNDGKFSIKFDRLVKFDANKPVISNLKLVQYGNETSYPVTASQTYGNNVFVKGVWWLTGTVTDVDKIGSLTINGTPLVQTNDSGVITPVSGKAWCTTDPDDDDYMKVVEFRFKLSTDGANTVGEQSVNIIASDAAAGTPNTQNETITVKYDNKAPVIAENPEEGRDISTKVQQYNGFYKFGSKAKEEDDVSGKKQSGFAYTAFYFKRTYGSTTKLYDVLQARSYAEHDISSLSPAELGSEAAGDTLVTKDGLYWFVKTVSTNDTASITMSNTSNVHKNSLVLIDGTYYLVDSVGSGTVTFTRNIPAGKTKAYVALAGIVNKSNEGHVDGAKPQWPGNGYYAQSDLNRDDGDLMVEDVSKLDTTWTWEANICSRNIPDGPVEICYVVYDNAGNCVSDSVSGFVCNNQPRIAGVTVKTDYTGNNEAEYVVSDYSASELSEDSVTGSIGTSPNTKKVYDPFANSLTKNDEYPLSQTMTAGTAANPVLKVRGLTQIIPEIVGGNGRVHYSYDVTNGTKSLSGTNTTTALYSETAGNLNYDYTVNGSAPINLQLGDLVYLGDTTTGIPFKFTFKDETEGLSNYTDTQKAALETQLGVKFEADLTVYLAINACQETWPTASIKPFYWESLTENSIYDSGNASSYKDLKGHIELEKDWTKKKTNNPVTYYSAYDGNASGTYLDADPKVSGEIVLKGTAFDAKLLKKIQIIINGVTKDVATYNSTSGLLESQFVESAYGTNGIWFNIDEQTVDSTGHSVEWTLNWNTQNTSFVSTTAKKDVEVKVIATNGGVPKRVVNASTGTLISVDGTTKYVADQVDNVHSNTIGDTPVQTGSTTDAQGNVINTAFYRMDVVPYVTDVQTRLSSANSGNPSVYSRTALGHYPVYMTHAGGDDTYDCEANIKVYGFNLKDGTLSFDEGDNGSNSVGLAAATGYYTMQIPTGARSGKATVTVGTGADAVQSLNNRNYDDSNGTSGQSVSGPTGDADVYGTYFYNRQPNDENNNRLTDDLYFDVWDFNSQAVKTADNSALDIIMKINPNNGKIGFAFCHGMLHWSMADGNNDSYKTWVKSNDFVQETGFAFDAAGNSFGTAAGGESGDNQADAYCLFTSRWGMQNRDRQTGYGDYWLRLESTGETKNGVYSLNKKRFESSSIATYYKGKNDSNQDVTDVYLAFYDSTNGEIRFRAGELSSGTKTNFGAFNDSYTNNSAGIYPKNYGDNAPFEILANGSGERLGYAGEYVSLGVTSQNVVVIVWYDSKNNNLMLSYNKDPIPETALTGTNMGAWESISTPLMTGAGKYCQIAVDGADNLHVAAYDSSNGDLRYVYVPYKTEGTTRVPNIAGKKECVVDTYMSVGKELTIDVAGDTVNGTVRYIPHIGYFGTTPKLPRYAYLADPDAFLAATDEDGRSGTIEDMYTGVWECGIVPSHSEITTDEKRRINIGVWKADITLEGETEERKGMRVASNHTGFSTGTSSADSNSGNCYGNETKNAVLGYGVRYTSAQDYVETAQMR